MSRTLSQLQVARICRQDCDRLLCWCGTRSPQLHAPEAVTARGKTMARWCAGCNLGEPPCTCPLQETTPVGQNLHRGMKTVWVAVCSRSIARAATCGNG